MFTNKELRNLIVPLFIEQFLLMFVGIADTFVVSFASEAAVSGVSLVTSFNTVLIFLFTALSSGGAVIISQYIGGKNEHAASRSAGQLLMISAVLSIAMAALLFSALFGLWMGWGVIGVAVGMSIDLVFRGMIFLLAAEIPEMGAILADLSAKQRINSVRPRAGRFLYARKERLAINITNDQHKWHNFPFRVHTVYRSFLYQRGPAFAD